MLQRRVDLEAALIGSAVFGRHGRRAAFVMLGVLAAAGSAPSWGRTEARGQPGIEARTKPVLALDGLRFRDLNRSGALEPYEDWRLTPERRAEDLVARMSLREKAGLMLIDTLNAGCEGSVSAKAFDYVHSQEMRRFILRNVVSRTPSCAPDRGIRAGSVVTPRQTAEFINSMQFLAEGSPLGIPLMFKSNARNHIDKSARAGINEAAGAFTAFPKEAGIAAAALGEGARQGGRATVADSALVRSFASVMGREWRSIGLRGMYGYMADLGTDPRWYRFHETFSEDADVTASIMRDLVVGLQGGPLSAQSDVALTIKHFPGGGPQEQGLDPHYSFGKNQVYPGGRFADHLKPFKAAIDAGAAAIMPYYGVPIDLEFKGTRFERVGMAFSRQVVTDLLRGELAFAGYVNSDTAIIEDRAWGLENKSVPERVAASINSGTDVLSGFNTVDTIIGLADEGLVSHERVTEAAGRLLIELFQLGLFENPYVDAAKANDVVGSEEHRALALEMQRKSIVLLQNKRAAGDAPTLPLRAGSRVFVIGAPAADFASHGYKVTDGAVPVDGRRPSARGHDYAVIRVEVQTSASTYRSDDPATGLDASRLDPMTRKPWGARDRCVAQKQKPCTDDGLIFGGAFPWEANNLSFSAMEASASWKISPTLSEIRQIMREAGAGKTILSIDFRQPYVIDEASGMRDAGAILATFGVSGRALADVLHGAQRPQGRLPFALASNVQAIANNDPDAPGYPRKDTLFPLGFGLTYANEVSAR